MMDTDAGRLADATGLAGADGHPSPDGLGSSSGIPSASGDFSIGGEVWPGVSKVLEEMGELGQVLGKLIGSHGNANHFDGTNLEDRLVEELGDLMGAISFFMEANGLDRSAVFNRKIRKYNLFWKWHGTASAIPSRQGQDAQQGLAGTEGSATAESRDAQKGSSHDSQ